jgi:hypothetical protein
MPPLPPSPPPAPLLDEDAWLAPVSAEGSSAEHAANEIAESSGAVSASPSKDLRQGTGQDRSAKVFDVASLASFFLALRQIVYLRP